MAPLPFMRSQRPECVVGRTGNLDNGAGCWWTYLVEPRGEPAIKNDEHTADPSVVPDHEAMSYRTPFDVASEECCQRFGAASDWLRLIVHVNPGACYNKALGRRYTFVGLSSILALHA